jgi:hypothetical protein
MCLDRGRIRDYSVTIPPTEPECKCRMHEFGSGKCILRGLMWRGLLTDSTGIGTSFNLQCGGIETLIVSPVV